MQTLLVSATDYKENFIYPDPTFTELSSNSSQFRLAAIIALESLSKFIQCNKEMFTDEFVSKKIHFS